MTSARAPRGRRPASPGQQGSAMLVVATILTALLAGGGIALYLQLQSSRSTSMTKSGRASLYCAEAGLTHGARVFTNNVGVWNNILDTDPANDPSFYPVRGDLDDDGVADYEVTLRDNDDEGALVANDPTDDNDFRVFVVSRCLQNAEIPRTVTTLLQVNISGHNYRNQSGGGSGNTGNQN